MPTHYVVVEGLVGEESTWRVVRDEEQPPGRRLYAFVGTCQTRRAALSLARALNEKRARRRGDVEEGGAHARRPAAGTVCASPPRRTPTGSDPPAEAGRRQAFRFLMPSR